MHESFVPLVAPIVGLRAVEAAVHDGPMETRIIVANAHLGFGARHTTREQETTQDCRCQSCFGEYGLQQMFMRLRNILLGRLSRADWSFCPVHKTLREGEGCEKKRA